MADFYKITLGAWNGLTLTIDPAIGLISFYSSGVKRSANVNNLTGWNVVSQTNQRVVLLLSNGMTMEAYAAGIVRFINANGHLTFNDGQPDIAAGGNLLQQLNADNWWLVSDQPWSITGSQLNCPGSIAIFYGTQDWLSRIAMRSPDELAIGGLPNEKFARAFRMGFWADIEESLAALRAQTQLPTMTVQNLDLWAGPALGMQSIVSETAPQYLLRIKGEMQTRIGGVTQAEIQSFVAQLIKGNLSDVTVYDNVGTDGRWRDGYFRVVVDNQRLLSLGFTTDQLVAALASINTLINRLAAAGVIGECTSTGGAVYDTDNFDSAGVFG